MAHRRRTGWPGPRTWLALACGAALSAAALGAASCIATSPELSPITDDDAGDDGVLVDSGAPDTKVDLGASDPHAVIGADPAHGPFSGGQRVLVHGNGFDSSVRVWFGDDEVSAVGVVPIDPTRVQVAAPPGQAGPIDVSAQNGDDESTRRTLVGGYHYDSLYAIPSSGPVAGGSQIRILGQGTTWSASTVATIDQTPCTELSVTTPTELLCTVPQGTPGAKSVAVTEGLDSIVVLDAYTYEDSVNGFRGGLSGDALSGSIKVLVYDNFTGDAVAGAHVVLGTSIADGIVTQVDSSGIVVVDDPSLTQPVTVTVSAACHSPITFVDVPVDTVTVYLDPVLIPSCAGDGDPPAVGGNPQNSGSVHGELVFEGGQEFQKGPFGVPSPQTPDEKQRAYVFSAQGNARAQFALPSTAFSVTPTSPGDAGYGFTTTVGPGNHTFYALAGIEDRSVTPPKFTAYVMGVVRGVPVLPGAITDEVFIPMSSTLDLAVTMAVDAPSPGPDGPDRLRATTAIRLGTDGYAILPAGQKAPLLPLGNSQLQFVGVPLLAGDLLGAQYASTARTVTGPTFGAPMSVLGQKLTTTSSVVVPMNAFIPIPSLDAPVTNSTWDDKILETSFAVGGLPVNLTVYDIQSGNGLVHWVVAVPAGSHAIDVPDIRAFDGEALPPGPLFTAVYGAFIEDLDYGKIRYRNLRPQGMTAYSLDFFSFHH